MHHILAFEDKTWPYKETYVVLTLVSCCFGSHLQGCWGSWPVQLGWWALPGQGPHLAYRPKWQLPRTGQRWVCPCSQSSWDELARWGVWTTPESLYCSSNVEASGRDTEISISVWPYNLNVHKFKMRFKTKML